VETLQSGKSVVKDLGAGQEGGMLYKGKISLTDDGWVARVIQHEVDHLNGTLIIDKFKKITSGQGLVEGYLEEK
jgi:hypothetical protein